MKQPAPWQKHRPSPSRSNRQTVISKVISKTISAIISTSYLTTVIANVISNTWAVAGKKLETKVSQSYLKIWVVAGRKLERELSQRYLKIKPTWLRSRTTCAEMTPTRIVPQPLAFRRTSLPFNVGLQFGGQACRSTSVCNSADKPAVQRRSAIRRTSLPFNIALLYETTSSNAQYVISLGLGHNAHWSHFDTSRS